MSKTSEAISIRTANISDIPQITILADQLGYPNNPQELIGRLQMILSNPEQTVLVADIPEMMTVGFVHLHCKHTLVNAPVVELGSLVVDQIHRGQGIGQRLILSSEEWAKAQGYFRIRLNANIIREKSQAFYMNRGFSITKTQHVFQKDLF